MSKKHDGGGAVPRDRARTFKGLLAAGLSLTLLGGGVGVATATASTASASAAPVAPEVVAAKAKEATKAVGITYEGGPGHPGPVWAGTWDNGTRGFCIDFELHTPTSSGTTKISDAIPGMNAKQTALIKAITNAYSKTTSATKAARAQLAIWVVEDDSAFVKWYKASEVSKADRKAVKAVVADAARGPFDIGVSTSKVHVGQDGRGKVKLTGGAAGGLELPVVLTASNAKIRTVNGTAGTKGKLDSGGLTFTYERTRPGKVEVKAALAVPSSKTAGLSVTPSGDQRTLSGGYVETAIANYAYDLTAGKPTISAKCDSDCQGVAALTFAVCNPSGADAVTWLEKVGGEVVATLSAAGGKCVKKSAKVADGDRIVASHCYTATVGGACATGTVKAGESYEVVCPVWVKAIYTMSCDCDGLDGASVTFTAPGQSARFYRGFVTVTKAGKDTVKQLDLVNGAPAKVDLGVLRDAKIAVSFQAYRDGARTVDLGGKHNLFGLEVA